MHNVLNTVESRFFEPPRETKIGSKNRRVREIRGKITVLDRGGGMTFGSSYRDVRKTEGSRNRYSTVMIFEEITHTWDPVNTTDFPRLSSINDKADAL